MKTTIMKLARYVCSTLLCPRVSQIYMQPSKQKPAWFVLSGILTNTVLKYNNFIFRKTLGIVVVCTLHKKPSYLLAFYSQPSKSLMAEFHGILLFFFNVRIVYRGVGR